MIDWKSDESVVRAMVPGARLGSNQRDTCGPTYFIENSDGNPISASSFDMKRPWGFLRAADPSVAQLDAAHETVLKEVPDPRAVSTKFGWMIITAVLSNKRGWLHTSYKNTEAEAWLAASKEGCAVAPDLTPPEAREDEFTAEEIDVAEKEICVGGKDAGIAFFSRHPKIAWAVATRTQAELNRLRAAIAGARVKWRVEQRLGIYPHYEWVRVVEGDDADIFAPYDSKEHRFRLVRITTISEVISVRSAGSAK